MPAFIAQYRAAFSLSPLIIYTSMPSRCKRVIASVAWGLSVSLASRSRESALVKSTFWLGMVSVPVLSMTRAFILRRFSSAVASLINICFCAALPMPTMRAVGVARPMAHGQAMTNTEMAERMACGRAALPPVIHQVRKVTSERKVTTGTKTSAAL